VNINKQLLARLAAADPAAAIEAQYGADGIAALKLLARGLEQIGEQLAFELLDGGITVIAALEPGSVILPADRSARVRPEQLPTLVEGTATIQVLDGELLLLREQADYLALAEGAVVYRFDAGDHFVIDGALWALENTTSFPSRWNVPTFFDLADSLRHYQSAVSPTSRCPHLRSAWHDPPRRWIFKNRPEEVLQDSLEQHLISSLRLGRIEIRREQPIQGKKPPDIKVTWSGTNRLAFVEVKWMGASVHKTEPQISWRPDEAEANKGAKQLAGYLDENAVEAPQHQTMGFLVVFDGRRKDIEYDTTDLTREQAMWFATRDIPFDPDYASLRHDFADPLRCFLVPLQPAA
jgi:hypothetical protein